MPGDLGCRSSGSRRRRRGSPARRRGLPPGASGTLIPVWAARLKPGRPQCLLAAASPRRALFIFLSLRAHPGRFSCVRCCFPSVAHFAKRPLFRQPWEVALFVSAAGPAMGRRTLRPGWPCECLPFRAEAVALSLCAADRSHLDRAREWSSGAF